MCGSGLGRGWSCISVPPGHSLSGAHSIFFALGENLHWGRAFSFIGHFRWGWARGIVECTMTWASFLLINKRCVGSSHGGRCLLDHSGKDSY